MKARDLEEKKIEETLNTPHRLSDDNPPSSLFSGVNITGKQVDASNILLDEPTLESFSKHSAIIRDYFAHMETNHKSISLLIGKLFSDKRKDNLKELLNNLENDTISRKGIAKAIEDAMIGAEDDQTRMLIKGLERIYELNNSILDRFKYIAKKQNPAYNFLDTYKNENKEKLDALNGVLNKTFKGQYSFIDIARHLNKNVDGTKFTQTKIIEEILKTFQGHQDAPDYLMELSPEATEQEIRANNTLKLDFITSFKEQMNDYNNFYQLADKHEEAVSAARIFMIKTFQSGNNEEQLGSLFWQEGMSNAEIETNKSKIKNYVEGAITSMKLENPALSKKFSPDTIIKIKEKITDKYVTAMEEGAKKSLNHIDSTEGLSVSGKTKIPPNIVMEEIFMKMTEDTVYNVFMSEKDKETDTSPAQILSAMVGEYNRTHDNQIDKPHSADEVIPVDNNCIDGKYEPPSKGGKNHKLATDALKLWNLSSIAKSIGNGTITKEEARKGIDKTLATGVMKESEKKVLQDELIKNFENPQLLNSVLDPEKLREIDMDAGDKVTYFNAKNAFAKYHKRNIFNSFGNYKITSKKERELQTCLAGAASPKHHSHSMAGEVSQCFDKFKQSLKEEISRLENSAFHAASALAGISVFAILLSALKEGKLIAAQNEIYKMEKERINAINFVNKAKTPQDKHFRANTVKNDKLNVSEEIVDKKDLDEWIFKTSLARHDFQKEKDFIFEEATADIKNAQTIEEKNDIFRNSFANILSANKLKGEFNEFTKLENEKEYYETTKKIKSLEKEIEKIGNALNNRDYANMEDLEKTYKEYISTINKGYESGAISIQDAKKYLAKVIRKQAITTKILRDKASETSEYIERKSQEYENVKLSNVPDSLKERIKLEKDNAIEEIKRFNSLTENFLFISDDIQESHNILSAYSEKVVNNPYIFSQKTAFGDREDAKIAMRERYSNPKIVFSTVAQDLGLLEKFQEINKYKLSEEQLDSITSLKGMIREFFVANRQEHTKGKISEENLLKELFQKKKWAFTETADVKFNTVEQNDKSKVQVIFSEKANVNAPRNDIQAKLDKALEAVDKFSNSSKLDIKDVSIERNKQIAGLKSPSSLSAALKIISEITGINVSQSEVNGDKNANSRKDGKLSTRTEKAINNDTTDNKYVNIKI